MAHKFAVSLSDLKPSCVTRMLGEALSKTQGHKEPRKLFRGQTDPNEDSEDDDDDDDVEEPSVEEDENSKLVDLAEENKGKSNAPEATEDDFDEGLVRKTMQGKVKMPKVVSKGKAPKQ